MCFLNFYDNDLNDYFIVEGNCPLLQTHWFISRYYIGRSVKFPNRSKQSCIKVNNIVQKLKGVP